MGKSDVSKTILVIQTGLLVLFLVFHSPYFLYTALGVALISLLFPQAGAWIEKGWFGIAHILGRINGYILLTLIFFLFLWPLGVLYRMFSNNPLSLKDSESSMFEQHSRTYQAQDLENPW